MVSGYYDIINKTLGKGHYGVVKLGRHCLSGEPVAIKIIEKSRLNTDSLNQLGNEIKILFKLCGYEHPNILKLYQTIDTRGKLFMITEYCGPHACDLHDYILRKQNGRNGTGLKETEAKIFFMQICSAISYCHYIGIVHRDLKPENILVTDYRHTQKFSTTIPTKINNEPNSSLNTSISPVTSTPKLSQKQQTHATTPTQPSETTNQTLISHHNNDKRTPFNLKYTTYPLLKLIDFGFANQWSQGEKMRTSCGTLAYSAPELLLGEPYDGTKVDVWGLGLMLYILIYGVNPFMQINDNETLTKILDCSYATPPKSNVDNANVVDLLRSLIKRDPTSRLTIDAILRHRWFEDIIEPVEHIFPITTNINKSITITTSDTGNTSDIKNSIKTITSDNNNDDNELSNNSQQSNNTNCMTTTSSEIEEEQSKIHDRVIQEMFKHPGFTGNRTSIESSLKTSSLSHQNFDPKCKLSNNHCVIVKKKISSGLVRLLDPNRARDEIQSGDESGSSLDQDSHTSSPTSELHHQHFNSNQKHLKQQHQQAGAAASSGGAPVDSDIESNKEAANNESSALPSSTSKDDYVYATYQLTRDRIIRQALPTPSVASPVPEPIPEEGGYCVNSSGCYFPYASPVGASRVGAIGLGELGSGGGGSGSGGPNSSTNLRVGSMSAALAYALPLARKCSLVNEESGCSSSSS